MFEAIAGWVIWGTMALGYVGVLVLTERSAARYVARPPQAAATSTVVIYNGASPIRTAQAGIGTSPALSPASDVR